MHAAIYLLSYFLYMQHTKAIVNCMRYRFLILSALRTFIILGFVGKTVRCTQ